MRIVIVTPAKPGTRHGNRNTALRWAAHLLALGHSVDVVVAWRAGPHDLMVALHARRSHASMRAWKNAYPDRPLVLVLTGTDLYRDIRSDADARSSLDLADRLVVLQEKGLDELRTAHRAKARVIHQSVRALKRHSVPKRNFLVTVIGHLRDEKDPFCAARALGYIPAEVNLRVVQIGGAMSADAAREARAFMRAEPRYRWLDELDHAGTMRWLARCHAMVISSRMEGGAHVVSEAIAAGVPVIASDIPGNRGLLGDAYPAYYPVGDDRTLATLLLCAQSEPEFLAGLAKRVRAQRALVSPARERWAIRELLAGLTNPGCSAGTVRSAC